MPIRAPILRVLWCKTCRKYQSFAYNWERAAFICGVCSDRRERR